MRYRIPGQIEDVVPADHSGRGWSNTFSVSAQQIERAIDALTAERREQLYFLLDEHHMQPSDMKLKAAVDVGRFDDRIARAVAD